jgi:hypothetical protein
MMVNVLPYVGKTDGITTHWRIRVGARDRDTSFTVAYNMSRALKADTKVRDVDFALHWDRAMRAITMCRPPSPGSTSDWRLATETGDIP